MIPNDKIICLIKRYRVESETYWSSAEWYRNEFTHGLSVAYGRCADDLEELLKSMKGGKTMTKYILTIRPAIPPEERHQLEDTLKNIGYHVMGSGNHTDGSKCDISFYEEGGKTDG